MSGFFTSPFLKLFVDWLDAGYLKKSGTFDRLLHSIREGSFPVVTDLDTLISLLEELKTDNPPLYSLLISLEGGSKIRGISTELEIPKVLSHFTIPHSILKNVGSALNSNAETICHNNLGSNSWKDDLSVACGRPLLLEQDINNGNIDFLFAEKSFPLNKGTQFNWSYFIRPYVLPFNTIRILDPYLYDDIDRVDIPKIIRTLAGRSTVDRLRVEIISDLGATSNWTSDQLIEKLNILSDLNLTIELYTQTGQASHYFHKRLIWTDFWVIYTDRSFDFLVSDAGRGIVNYENTLYMTGKYASRNSIWHQIQNNWKVYRKKSRSL